MIDVTFKCGGCDESVTVRNAIRRTFQSFSGGGCGLGTYSENSVADIAPEGWVAFDPYTQVTYCPECWAEIEAGVAASREQSDDENG